MTLGEELLQDQINRLEEDKRDLTLMVWDLCEAIRQTLDANGHLADGEVCTLLPLKLALRKVGTPWAGDELHNAPHEGAAAALSRTLPLHAVVGHGR